MLLPQGSKMLASAQLRIQKNMMTSENLMKVSQFLVQEEEGVKIVLVGPKSSYGANGKENQKIGIGRLEKYDVKTDSRYEYGELTERHCSAMYNLKNKGSPVKMLICVTMYNEDAADLCRTLSGIYQNLKYFYNDDDVAVIVVADGFDKVHPTVIDYMHRIGVLKVDSTKYNDLLKEMKDPKLSGGRKLPSRAAFLFGKKVNSIGINLDNNDTRKDGKLNLFFCIKLKNSGKLSSHKWFFLGFCNYLNPSHCMLLDAGTRPSDRAIFRFNEAFELDPQVGGVCGNMGVILEKREFPVISCCISCIQKEEEEVEKTIPPNKDEFRKEADQKCKRKQLIENSRTSVYENRPKLVVKENPAGAKEKEPFIVEIQDDPDPRWETIKQNEEKKWEKMGCCSKATSGCVWFFDKIFGNLLYFLLKFLIFLEEIHRKFFSSIINVQFSQMYEYEISHILDKSMESFFGFIQVLPGAFSAYRWEAIKSDKLMRKYFATVLEDEKRELSCMEANVYLAEDRVMCFNIFAMRGKNFILKYVEDARAWTDVMVNLIRLISQRRRWLNGSWFAGLHVLDNTLDIEMSSHSFFRKCAFYILTMYNIMTTILTYISIALFYVSLNISVQSLEEPLGQEPNAVLSYTQGIILLFDALLVLQLFISLTYKVSEPEVEVWYKAIFLLMGLYTFGSYIIIIYYILQNFFFGDDIDYGSISGLFNTMTPVMWSTLVTALSYAIPILLNLGSVPRLAVGALSGIVYMPINMIVIPIYSYCNLDDVSWGTREDAGDKKADKESKTQTYKDFKARQVVVWVLTNLVCAYAFLYWLQRDEGSRSIVVSVFIYVFCGVLAFKAVFACLNKIKETFINCCRCGCFALYKAENKRKEWQKQYANGQAPPTAPRGSNTRDPAPAPVAQRVPPPQMQIQHI